MEAVAADTGSVATLAHGTVDPALATDSARAADLDPDADALIEQSRARVQRRRGRRGGRAAALVGGAFPAAALPLALLVASERPPSRVVVLVLVLAYAVASRIEFEIGTGSAIPTQLVFVPMLFVVPVGTVPLLVAAGLILGGLVDTVHGRVHLERVPVLLASSWHAVGPAIVLALAGERGASLGDWPLYLAALAAQFGLDVVSTGVRERLALGVPARAQLRFMGWVCVVDLALAPVGLLAALAATRYSYAFLLALPLAALLAHFARERRSRIDHALELGNAYRGTAFLLGDVIEADDAYTGSHSRDVVSLVLRVCDRLGVDGKERRNAEFAALLHDVGKIRIPAAIINKPGALSSEEWEIMKTHTIEGQRLLEKVGGLLGEVGRIVRSCHERFDGRGYPDGLVGAATPLVARIVACCDAFNAMTTDRSYRRAMSLSAAIQEVRANAGTQFDPDVVDALVADVETELAAA